MSSWGDPRINFEVNASDPYRGKTMVTILATAESLCGKEFTAFRKVRKNEEFSNKDAMSKQLRSKIHAHSKDCNKCKARGWTN